ncbi:MAG: diguanylate cyclase [Clostridia bacterium]|nr:diguanylate cyclase [Clostridia bacterium]
MKTNSIKFKFLITLIASILAVTIFIGGISIYEVDTYVQRETKGFVDVTAENESAQLNAIFADMEKSVNIISSYVLDYIDSFEDVKSPDKQKEIIDAADGLFADVASHTTATVAYYLRFSIDIADSKTGFFVSKSKGSEEFTHFEITDLALYDRADTEHVGWYWQPYEAGSPIWMKPYYNQNNEYLMISYVVPLYCENQFVGVVGMDFDYNVLIERVHEIEIYENGFAHLKLDGMPIHNESVPAVFCADDYMQVSSMLLNGMELVISASYDDIRQIRGEIMKHIISSVLIISAVFILMAIIMAKRIVSPLKQLTEASKKLADGDYEMEPIRSNTYEIQLLSTAFENMTMHLREHENLQYLLAYRDSMTGLRNTTSYKVWMSDFDKEIQNSPADFGVIVLDVNYLKETNDKYGHDVGNKLIIAVGQLISSTFNRSPVFRIGGDEFLVILQNRDLEEYEELCAKFDYECGNENIEANGENIPISVARGVAMFDPEKDTKFIEVFNRADDAMYKHKRRTKSTANAKQLTREKEEECVTTD